MQLECSKPDSPVPLGQRRRGFGSIRSRQKWVPSPLRPDGDDKGSQPGISPRSAATPASKPVVPPQPAPDAVVPCLESATMAATGDFDSSVDMQPVPSTTAAIQNPFPQNLELGSNPSNFVYDEPWLPEGVPSQVATAGESPWDPALAEFLNQGFDLYVANDTWDTTAWADFQPPVAWQTSPGDLGTSQLVQRENHTPTLPQCDMTLLPPFDTMKDSIQSLPHPQASTPSAISSWPAPADFPCVERLNSVECRALDYYRSRFSPSRSLKPFASSSYALFLRLAREKKVILHLILALSMQDLLHVDPNDSGNVRLTRLYLERGMQTLREYLGQDGRDHVTVLTAFWLLTLFMLNGKAFPAVTERTWLNSALTEYVRENNLHRAWSATIGPGGRGNEVVRHRPGKIEAPTHSLLAKLLTMLVFGHVHLNFRTYIGHFAELFFDDTEVLHDLTQVSQNYLQLNHGHSYPIAETLCDIESAECYRLYLEEHRLYHWISQLFWINSGDYSVLEQAIESLEAKCDSFIRITSSPFSAQSQYTRRHFQIDTIVCEFYAIQIYHFRCREQPLTAAISNAASSYLRIASRIWKAGVRYSWFNRSLFIVGIETTDPIHRDWIQDHMAITELKHLLLTAWAAEESRGKRLAPEDLREILRTQYPGAESGRQDELVSPLETRES
ncbi:hypothetical protein A1O1_01421 [Capronia coronata CBS 617.96]|uniref:Transcription factor domain-containing protein n=1 Tax=Capronia coronata CBS 617.96 TaxID=1182541 RepID=W9Z2U9_9EURO|nr:uncharacterized protein A1O1_01421 [Capronia coronata CBS 617.96]EXJ96295.1 hypothetical protein A1O1_01421 [Capronia coronata CBS 617.96]